MLHMRARLLREMPVHLLDFSVSGCLVGTNHPIDEGTVGELRMTLERWTPSAGQLIDVAKWNLLRYIPVKMRGAEDDKEETAKPFASL